RSSSFATCSACGSLSACWPSSAAVSQTRSEPVCSASSPKLSPFARLASRIRAVASCRSISSSSKPGIAGRYLSRTRWDGATAAAGRVRRLDFGCGPGLGSRHRPAPRRRRPTPGGTNDAHRSDELAQAGGDRWGDRGLCVGIRWLSLGIDDDRSAFRPERGLCDEHDLPADVGVERGGLYRSVGWGDHVVGLGAGSGDRSWAEAEGRSAKGGNDYKIVAEALSGAQTPNTATTHLTRIY